MLRFGFEVFKVKGYELRTCDPTRSDLRNCLRLCGVVTRGSGPQNMCCTSSNYKEDGREDVI